MKIYYTVIAIAGIVLAAWSSSHYHLPWPMTAVPSFVGGSLISAAWRKPRKPKAVLPPLRKCHWCEYQAIPVQVLFHEAEVHKA